MSTLESKSDPQLISDIKFDDSGLVPVVAQDVESGDVLMLAWMNAEAVRRSLVTGRMTYWSRSRQCYWEKGQTSGNTQGLVDLRLDCDRDCLLAIVDQTGSACHLGERSCFFRPLGLT